MSLQATAPTIEPWLRPYWSVIPPWGGLYVGDFPTPYVWWTSPATTTTDSPQTFADKIEIAKEARKAGETMRKKRYGRRA